MTQVGFGMMKNDNGKRERSNLEEDVEFMPLSKRINNIHLTQSQGGGLNGIHQQQQVNGHNGEASHSHHNANNNGFENNIYSNEHQQNGHVGHVNGHVGHVNGHGHYEGQQQHQADNPSLDFPSSANTSSLCINNPQQSHHSHNSNGSSDSSHSHCQPSVNGVNHQGQNYEHEGLSGAMVSASDNNSSVRYLQDYQYEPVLNQNANPHYYEQNRQLFELYMERIHRHNLPPHPHFYNSNNDPTSVEHHHHQQHHQQRQNPQT